MFCFQHKELRCQKNYDYITVFNFCNCHMIIIIIFNQAINDKILSLDYGECSAEIITVDAQESYNGGVLVLVTGYLTGKDNVRRKFTQSFFLAPQDKGYFVLNDVFRYVDEANHVNQASITDIVEAPITPEQGICKLLLYCVQLLGYFKFMLNILNISADIPAVYENDVSDQTAVPSDETNGEEVYNPSENGDGTVEEEETPVAEVVDEIPEETRIETETDSKIEEVPKKSYAYIVSNELILLLFFD